MDTKNATNEEKNKVEYVSENIKKVANDANDEIVKSGKDWVQYIKSHPFQSVVFGIIGYYAIKGLMSNVKF